MSLYEALDRSGVLLTNLQSLILRQYRDYKMSLNEWFVLFERVGVSFHLR